MELASRRIRRRASGALVAAGLVAGIAHAQSVRLNGPLAQPGAGRVEPDFAFSLDSDRMVFRADPAAGGAPGLYSAPADASAPALRLAPLAGAAEITRFQVGAGGTAVFLADLDQAGVQELYRTPLAGDDIVKLSQPLVEGGQVRDLLVTPDGTRVVFLADARVAGTQEFFAVPIDGSAAPIALDPAPTDGAVMGSWMHPDGTRILFTRREPDTTYPWYERERLFALPLDGSLIRIDVAVSPPYADFVLADQSSGFESVEFLADGARAVLTDFHNGKDGREAYRLLCARLDGTSSPVVLNQPSMSFDSTNFELPFGVHSGANRAAYLERSNVYSVALDGTGRVQLDPGTWNAIDFVAVSPNGVDVVFWAWRVVGGAVQYVLWRAALGGGGAAMLAGPLPSSTLIALSLTETNCFFARYGISLTSSFRALSVVPLDGSTPPRVLNGPEIVGTGIVGGGPLTLLPGERVLYQHSVTPYADFELWLASADPGVPAKRISAAMPNDRDVARFLVAPDGERVAYLADQTFESTPELFAAALSSLAPPVSYLPLQGGPVVGDVVALHASPDGKSVVYQADQDTDEQFEFYRAPVNRAESGYRLGRFFSPLPDIAFTPSGDRIVVEHALGGMHSVRTEPNSPVLQLDSTIGVPFPFEVSADSSRLVYRKRSGFLGDHDLMSVPVDASKPATTLFHVSGRNVSAFGLAPDGSRVVYLAEQSVSDVFELFSIRIDGESGATKLNAPLATNRDVTDFRISPDGRLVAYLADQRTNDRFELFVVPIDGSRVPQRLNGTLVTAGDVIDFAFTPVGDRIVYRADQNADARFELFSSSTDGRPGKASVVGGPEPDFVQLTFLDPAQDVEPDYRVTTRLHVLHRVTTAPFGPSELYQVSALGGAPPSRLNQTLDAGGTVYSFQLAPDELHVVFEATRDAADVRELFAVGTLGGPVAALDPLPGFADVREYRIDSSSAFVVFLANRLHVGADELFTVPIDGSQASARINDPLPDGAAVQPGFVLLPHRIAVYRADQETAGVLEVFRTGIDPWRRRVVR